MRKYKKMKLNIFLITFISLIFISVGYSVLSQELTIKGIVSGINDNDDIIDQNSNKNFDIEANKGNSWTSDGYYFYIFNFDVVNNSQVNYNNFIITIKFNDSFTLDSSWGIPTTLQNNIVESKYNNIITPNQKVSLGIIVKSNNPDLKIYKIKVIIDENTAPIKDENIIVTFKITNSWGNYNNQYNLNIQNNGDKNISYWEIHTTVPENTSFINGWDAEYEINNTTLIIKPKSYNNIININNSIDVGFQLFTNSPTVLPNVNEIL